MSWLYSQVLVEEYLGDISLDGEQSVQLNGSNTQQAYCAPDKMTGFSRLSRFGMTFKPLMESRGEELLTLYLAAFHAKTSLLQEKVLELTESEAGCGDKWRGSFTKYDPSSCSWRTHQCSLLGDLDEFSETWPQWGLMRDGECWEQRTLEQTIRGTEFGLSPNGVDSFHTPNTTGLDGGSNSRKALKKKRQNWPTPKAIDGIVRHSQKMMEKKFYGKGDVDLTIAVKMNKWPTPVTRDYKDTGTQESMTRALNKRDSPGLALMVGAATGGKLNPTWVEWLMGWPLGWTDLKPLEMDKSHCVQQPLGES
jgi:hypothetical protein